RSGGGSDAGRGGTGRAGAAPGGFGRGGAVIEGTLLASSSGPPSQFTKGERVFHLKFGYGHVSAIDGNKLTVQFEKAGEKRVLESFVDKV
ncbi:MAG: hypothetical protein B7Z15_22510, partial [Rhizobiales bacterium 32-66-8]